MVTLIRQPGENASYMSPPTEGGLFFSMLVSPEEWDAIELRGYATLDGVKARIVPDASDRESGFARFALEKPYERNHPCST